MTYREFNGKILNFYLEKSNSGFFTLAIDRYEIEKLIPVEDLKYFINLRSNWHLLMEDENQSPQYFGLLAIQCFAASEMHCDDAGTANAYTIRLCDILGIERSRIQGVFKGINPEYPIQEEIWFSAKDYLGKSFGMRLEIPNRTAYRGRFVQYPISQSLLNTEDLKSFTVFFFEEFQKGEFIPYTYFKGKMESWLRNDDRDHITKRTGELLGDVKKSEAVSQQVYNYYSMWDGVLHVRNKGKNINQRSFQTSYLGNTEEKLSLIYNGANPTFYLNGQEIQSKELFAIPNYKYIYKGILILNESDYYPNEFVDARFLAIDAPAHILIDPMKNWEEEWYIKQIGTSILKMENGCILYRIPILSPPVPDALNKYIQTIIPIKLFGGIRISKAKDYLKGYGPSIIGKIDSVIFNHRKCTYNPATAEMGIYKVRTADYRDLEFKIVDPIERTEMVQSKDKGWNFRKYDIQVAFDLEGAFLRPLNAKNIKPIIRDWIDSNLGEKATNNDNALLKAITNWNICILIK